MLEAIYAQLQVIQETITAIFIALGLLIGGLGGVTEQIPIDLELKADKADVVYSHEYTKYERNNKGEIMSQKQVVNYGYKSGEIAPALDNEIIELRTPNIVTRNLGGNKRSAQSGYIFYQENGWKKIKFGTTTKEAFDTQTISFWDKFIVWAADTGATSPGTMADDAAVGTITWSNPDNAKVSDSSYAIADHTTAIDTSHYLKATNFGFSIPSGATIDGILVEAERLQGAGSGSASESSAKIVKSDGSIGAENKASGSFPVVKAYKSYGDSSDLWSESWSDTDINDLDFGFVLSSATLEDVSRDATVDHIRITVTYTEGAPAVEDVVVPGIIMFGF